MSDMCTKHCKGMGPPPKAITWHRPPQSMKIGLNQPNTVMHIHRTGEFDERNATCGALLARSLSIFFRSLFLPFLFLSLFLCGFLSLCLPHSVVFVANFLPIMSYVRWVI